MASPFMMRVQNRRLQNFTDQVIKLNAGSHPDVAAAVFRENLAGALESTRTGGMLSGFPSTGVPGSQKMNASRKMKTYNDSRPMLREHVEQPTHKSVA
jgi:hypothetical protein